MVELDLALLVLRLTVGLLFMGHGLQKLAGWFGGHGLAGTGGWLESIGFRPGRLWAWSVALMEVLSGVGLVLGLFTSLSALLVVAAMIMAILTVHLSNGLWATAGGYEYNLVLIAAAVALGLAGPGRFALDPMLGISPMTAGQFGLALVLVLAANVILNMWRQSQIPQQQR